MYIEFTTSQPLIRSGKGKIKSLIYKDASKNTKVNSPIEELIIASNSPDFEVTRNRISL